MRIGKKPNIENQISIGGNAIAISEADDGDEHRALVGIPETLGDKVAQLMDIELRRIDDHVSEFADGLHHVAFLAEALAHGDVFAHRMRAARLAVASEERVFRGVNEYKRDGMILAQVFEK